MLVEGVVYIRYRQVYILTCGWGTRGWKEFDDGVLTFRFGWMRFVAVYYVQKGSKGDSRVSSIEKGHVNNACGPGNVATLILKWDSNFSSHAKLLSTSALKSTYVSTVHGFARGGGSHSS